MKKIRLVILLTLMMVVVSFQGNTQEGESGTVIIRLVENYTTKDGGVMAITHAGKTDVITNLQNLNPKNIQQSGDENAVILEQEINKWKKQGFQVTELSTSSGTAYVITTVLLSK